MWSVIADFGLSQFDPKQPVDTTSGMSGMWQKLRTFSGPNQALPGEARRLKNDNEKGLSQAIAAIRSGNANYGDVRYRESPA
jgi:hypothetical protein